MRTSRVALLAALEFMYILRGLKKVSKIDEVEKMIGYNSNTTGLYLGISI